MTNEIFKFFEENKNNKKNPYYNNREERNLFVAKELIKDNCKILNLGGGGARYLEKGLRKYGNNSEVIEVDIEGNNDFRINLNSKNKLPFKDKEYDVVTAFDVLEHLEYFHFVFDEMIRISKKTIIISLPISSYEIFEKVILGLFRENNREKHGVFSKYYGLPLEEVFDRHRWWLYFEDVVGYSKHVCVKESLNVEFYISDKKLWKKIMRRILPKRIFYNFFIPSLFIKFEKID